LVIDGTRADFIDQDIIETLDDFIKAASDNNIQVEMENVRGPMPVNRLAEPGVGPVPAARRVPRSVSNFL
jgi:hypothetical protein